MKNYLTIFVLVISVRISVETLSEPFRQFLRNTYGADTERELSREDMGGGGSFGGGLTHVPGSQTKNRPVILVHGITNTAGTFGRIQHYFLEHGYSDEEVYGTTYGDGGRTPIMLVTMNCHYIKIIRMMILSVSQYTSSKVNVIGYSMGSPIARKAIMGGICADTNEDLGPPLSGLINTYIGVAGANFGSFLCVIPAGSCNLINGMACGSRFLNDVNSRQRYEGDNIYTIFSTGDDKVGYQACGRLASQITGENQAFVQNGLNHDQVIFDTANLQYNLITHNHP
ncbi:lipase (class 2) domain-containing protein [Ditylenchus destructor]|nr:lipase (class 2) domain-containing protein [Ditylenchus destructor]